MYKQTKFKVKKIRSIDQLHKKLSKKNLAIITLIVLAINVPLIAVTLANNPISHSSSLIGTWKTPTATKFYFRTPSIWNNSLDTVGSEDRMVTLIIKSTSDPNTLWVEETFTYSNRTFISNYYNDYSGYVPDVSPMYYDGKISGDNFTLISPASSNSPAYTVGNFTVTGNSMTGTWDDLWTQLWTQEVYTNTNALTLVKQ